jgi:hypothetical protein
MVAAVFFFFPILFSSAIVNSNKSVPWEAYTFYHTESLIPFRNNIDTVEYSGADCKISFKRNPFL